MLEIFLFSYNRGKYLKNCLDSIKKHAPNLKVTIFDDGSSDPETQDALAEYSEAYQVVVTDKVNNGHYVGGLYDNMNKALASAQEEFALFIQEDMQLVRDVNEQDIEHVKRFFDKYPDSIELHNAFLKGRQRAKDGEVLEIDENGPFYFRAPGGKGSVNFSAVGVINVGRLKRDSFEFRPFEAQNDEIIGQQYTRMGITPYPWMMWLPFSETSKFKRKGILQRYAEWKTAAGFYPYRPMTSAEVENLLSRGPEEFPYAEDWLSPQGLEGRSVWNFSDAAKFVPFTKKVLKFRKKLDKRRNSVTRH
ncbi:Glycosyltransferase involved in cell wall bisynthesis [Thiohalospira halophila DSM 15071]|uniref:Glycosyltransferase involved in cell wall bisynthesis n=1 Tax=Thiohalospira halophila DSM 15071 TaxID=1123397 RepID=A0A1I1RSD2_9GAMM|nr:glycosyltransferase family 2 protein [Thiohalospira halophila]SFD36992.1 Glycosyltransferase involved in cell wall bisynthesis [Thiohalospira halophila DSM 15071]